MSNIRLTPRPRGRALVAGVATLLLAAGATTLGAPAASAAAANPPIRITDGTRDTYVSSVSDDGNFVLYTVDPTDDAGTNGFVALRDRQAGTTQQIGPLGAAFGELSADGSTALYLVGRDTTCGGTTVYVDDVYVWKRSTGTSVQISPATCALTIRSARISADGQRVAYDDAVFQGNAAAPVESVQFYDAATATVTKIGSGAGASISDNGRYVAYVKPDKAATLSLYDRTAGTTTPVVAGALGAAPVSNDGRYVTYGTDSGIVSLDRSSGTKIQIDLGAGSSSADQTPDGRYVAFSGDGNSGTAGIWDRTTGDVLPVGSADAELTSVSADGKYITFDSDLAEGVPGHVDNGNYDVYLLTRPATAAPRTAAESFVTAAYQDYIGRAPGPVERGFGLYVVGDALSIQKRAQFTTALAKSDTYLGAVVNKLYDDTLGRPGDAGGVAYWTDQLRTGKVTVAQTAGLFYASPEYFSGYGHSDLTTWVTDLYNKVLLRGPDQEGLNYYVALAQRINRYTVAYPFYQSLESSNTRVKALYQHFLDRPADQGGLDYWGSRIPSLGDVALASNLTLSDEYLSKAHTRFP